MKRQMRTVLLALVAASLLAGCGAKNMDVLLPEMAANFESIKSYELTPSLYIPQAGTDVQVKTSFKCPKMMRADVTYPVSVSVVCDGKKLLGCAPDYNTCIQLDLSDEEGVLPASALAVLMIPHLNYVQITDRYDAKVAGKEKLDDRKTVVFDLVRKDEPKSAFQAPKAKIWVEEDRALPLRMETMNEEGVCKTRTTMDNFTKVGDVWLPQDVRMETGDGMSLLSLSITDMTVNEEISDDLFAVKAPDDCVVLEELPAVSPSDIPEILLLY